MLRITTKNRQSVCNKLWFSSVFVVFVRFHCFRRLLLVRNDRFFTVFLSFWHCLVLQEIDDFCFVVVSYVLCFSKNSTSVE